MLEPLPPSGKVDSHTINENFRKIQRELDALEEDVNELVDQYEGVVGANKVYQHSLDLLESNWHNTVDNIDKPREAIVSAGAKGKERLIGGGTYQLISQGAEVWNHLRVITSGVIQKKDRLSLTTTGIVSDFDDNEIDASTIEPEAVLTGGIWSATFEGSKDDVRVEYPVNTEKIGNQKANWIEVSPLPGSKISRVILKGAGSESTVAQNISRPGLISFSEQNVSSVILEFDRDDLSSIGNNRFVCGLTSLALYFLDFEKSSRINITLSTDHVIDRITPVVLELNGQNEFTTREAESSDQIDTSISGTTAQIDIPQDIQITNFKVRR